MKFNRWITVLVVALGLVTAPVFGYAAEGRLCLLLDDHTDNTEEVILDLGYTELPGGHTLLAGMLTFRVEEPAYTMGKPVVGTMSVFEGNIEMHLVGSDMARAVGNEQEHLRFSRLHLELDPSTYAGIGRGYIQNEEAEYYYDLTVTKMLCDDTNQGQ